MPTIKTPVLQGIQDEFNQYCPELIINNLPMIDGVLLSHKKILWGLYKNKIYHNKPFIKSLKAIGYITNFYVFGDNPLYSTMTNMANNYMNIPLLEGKGSWGNKLKANGSPAHQRYTECRMSEFGEYMLKGVEKNSVPMKPNYDNSEIEPIVAPSIAPNIFLNVSQSISISESSKIPSFNAIETCDSFIHYIKTRNINETIDILKCPDFQTAGGKIVYDKTTFDKIYRTGRGSFSLVGKYTFDQKKNILSIYEIPYETTIEAVEKKILDGVENGIFKEIIDTRVGSGKEGIRLDLYLRKNTNLNNLEQKLRKYTPYESKFSCNFTVLDLDFKTPVLMSLEDIIGKWIQHRHNCIINETNYDITYKDTELNKLYGIKTISNHLDKAISIIRSSKTEKVAIEKLVKEFNLNEDQAKYISTIKLLNINQEWIFNKIKNIEDLENEVKSLKTFISDNKAIDDLIISQLEEVKKKYGQPRKTEILYESDTIEIPESDLIEDYNCYISASKENYLYKYLRRTDNFKLKDDDEIIKTESTSNKATLLIFTSLGNCHKLFLHDIQEKLPSQLGHYLPSLINLQQNEKIISVQVTRKYEGNLINIFKSGRCAKVSMQSFKTDQKRSMLKNAISTESPLVNQFIITDDIDIICKSSIDKVLITSTSQFNAKGSKNTNGDGLIKSKNDSTLVFCQPLDNIDKDKLDVEYYKGNRNAVGSYLKKEHSIQLLTK